MPCPRTQQANLPACSLQPPINAERQAGKLWIPFFKVFWYDSTRGMNPRSTDCEADALTTTPSRRSVEVNISLNDSSSLSFLNVYAPPIGSSPKDSRTNFFSSYLLLSYVKAEAVEFSRFCFHTKRTDSTSLIITSLPCILYNFVP